jgi:hypothetical protein
MLQISNKDVNDIRNIIQDISEMLPSTLARSRQARKLMRTVDVIVLVMDTASSVSFRVWMDSSVK